MMLRDFTLLFVACTPRAPELDRSVYAWMAGRVDLTRDVELPEDVLDLGGKLHEIGTLAGTTVRWNACAGCHQGGC